EELSERLALCARKPFDLETGPVFRVAVYSRSTNEFVLLISLHHIVGDFWSMGIVVDEFTKLYCRKLVAADLAPLPGSYRGYVEWHAGMMARERDRLRKYWEAELGGELPILSLPHDRRRPPVPRYRGSTVGFAVGAPVVGALKAICRAGQATLFSALLAAYQVLLARYANQDEILVGTPTFGRQKAAFRDVVGYFVNPVVIRSRLDESNCFVGFLN